MIDSFNKLSIAKYLEIKDILEEERDEYICMPRIIAVLNDLSEDEVSTLPLSQFKDMARHTGFLFTPMNAKAYAPKTLMINGREYEVTRDAKQLTAGQYIDFQTFGKMGDEYTYLPNMLACFIVPKGKRYGEGYDVMDMAETLKNHLDIYTASQILNFFGKASLKSIKRTLLYLETLLWRLRRKEKTPEIKEQIAQAETLMKEYKALLLNGRS